MEGDGLGYILFIFLSIFLSLPLPHSIHPFTYLHFNHTNSLTHMHNIIYKCLLYLLLSCLLSCSFRLVLSPFFYFLTLSCTFTLLHFLLHSYILVCSQYYIFILTFIFISTLTLSYYHFLIHLTHIRNMLSGLMRGRKTIIGIQSSLRNNHSQYLWF